MSTLSANSGRRSVLELSPKRNRISRSNTPAAKESEEWTLAAKRSCLNMTVMEPCVNKAVAHLELLNDLVHRRSQGLSSEVTKKLSAALSSRGEKEKPDAGNSDSVDLIAEGVAIGITKNAGKAKSGWDISCMVSGMMDLLAKLEKDRQETLMAIAAENQKAKMLQEKLDREKERRLVILPEAVQAEHEECMKNIKHLQWHAAREWKKWKKQQEIERVFAKQNEDLKIEVKKYVDAGPQMDEKMEQDKLSMLSIQTDQEKTSEALAVATKECKETEAEFFQLKDDSISKRQNLSATKTDAEKALSSAQVDLDKVSDRYLATSRSVQEAEQRIQSLEKKVESMVAEQNNKELRLSAVVNHVKELEEECGGTDDEKRVLEERKEKLTAIMESQRKKLDAKRQALKSEREKADLTLKQSQRSLDEMEQNIDTARETIIATKKKIVDDEKGVERAQRELAELDNQIAVALADFTKIQQDHVRISDELAFEKHKMEDNVETLQSKISNLNQAIQDENRIRCLYENKIDTNKAQIEKMKAEYEQAMDEAQKSVEHSNELGKEQENKLAKLEKIHSERLSILRSTEEELAAVQKEYVKVEQELNDKISELAPLDKQLRAELLGKVNKIELLSEKIKDLEVKIDEAIKSSKVMEKLELTTSSAIESLTSELGILEEQLAIERLKEQSWRDEYKEISDFSAEANTKHEVYLKERRKYLQQCKSSLYESIARNSELSDEFLRIQKEFIEIKARAIASMEGRLSLENSIKDHKQLLMSLDFLISALKEYYQIRGQMGHWNLEHFTDSSSQNVHNLHILKTKYEHILSIMQNFFGKESQAQ